MKKTKIISVLLIVVMLFSSVSIGAYAATDDTVMTISLGTLDRVNSTMAKRVSGELPQANEPKFANASPYRFYDNLTETEKIIYNGFVRTKVGLNSTPKGDFRIEITNGDHFSDNGELISDAICYAAQAVIDDHPELFWLLSMPYDTRNNDITVERSGNNYVLHFRTNINLLPYNSLGELEREYNNTLWAAQNIAVTGTTRYEKVKSITDKLCALADYAKNTAGKTANNSKIFFPSSCLLSPYETVCDGYSKAFKMICDINNIPSIIVCGYGGTPGKWGGHAWNYVQLEDGRWYALDLTWIDGAKDMDYFLVGSKTRDSEGYTFETTHEPVGDRFTGINGLTYPKLNPDAFDPNKPIKGDVNGDKQLTLVDARWVLLALAESITLDSTLQSRADVNGDGRVTLVDARMILQGAAGLRVLQ